MIDHMGISVRDVGKSKAFYLKALETLGYILCMDDPDGVSFRVPKGHGKGNDPAGEFWIYEDNPMVPRIHVAFSAASCEHVDAFFAAALDAGGTDNGEPGLRPEYHADYYAAFVLDPDGYNIEAVCHSG